MNKQVNSNVNISLSIYVLIIKIQATIRTNYRFVRIFSPFL